MADRPEKRYHEYYAKAEALSGDITLPLLQEVKPPTYVKLNERGGYHSQHVDNYRLGGIVSFRSAYTQVGGNPDTKADHGWNTLTTSVIEGLNVLDIVTADRMFVRYPRIIPLLDMFPTVTFLGTRFENLRIAGHELKLDLDLDMLGPKPKKDAGYMSDRDFRSELPLSGNVSRARRISRRISLRITIPLPSVGKPGSSQLLAGQPGGRRIHGSKLRPCHRRPELR